MKIQESKIKYVKKARMWCKTSFTYSERRKKMQQKQEWFNEKP